MLLTSFCLERIDMKVRLYKTVIRPVVLYTSETWILNKAEEELLNTLERKMMRGIFGTKKNGGRLVKES